MKSMTMASGGSLCPDRPWSAAGAAGRQGGAGPRETRSRGGARRSRAIAPVPINLSYPFLISERHTDAETLRAPLPARANNGPGPIPARSIGGDDPRQPAQSPQGLLSARPAAADSDIDITTGPSQSPVHRRRRRPILRRPRPLHR